MINFKEDRNSDKPLDLEQKNPVQPTHQKKLFLNTTFNLGRKRMKLNFLKTISYVVLITFMSQQVVSANPQIAETVHGFRPVATYDEASEKVSTVNVKTGFDAPVPTTAEFLNQTLSLSTGGADEVNKVVRRLDDAEVKRNENYEYTRYSFEDALEQLRPEYAVAVIVENLNEENLKELLALDFEVGIGALKGEIVLFTSGHQNDIRVTEAVKNIMTELALMAHTHPLETHTEGPSQLDLEVAGEATEFVLTDSAVYAYNAASQDAASAEKSTYSRFLAELQRALSEERKSIAHNVEARAALNQLIVEMDLANDTRVDTQTLRASDEEGLVLFSGANLLSVPSQDKKKTSYEILDHGRELRITGNSWKAIPMDIVITEDTVLEFEFKSAGEIPDFNSLGFSKTNNEAASKNQTFTFNGWENFSKLNEIRYTADGEWQVLRIRVGDYFQGAFSYLMLSNDADKNQPTDVRFKNIKIFEKPKVAVRLNEEGLLTLGEENLYSVPAQDLKKESYQILSDGNELRFLGNSWKAISLDAQITEDTVLEFEFKSSGEMPDFNGIGFSETNDEGASKNQTFTFNGWQNYSKFKSIRYSGDGEWQHIKIRAGDYFQGDFNFLILSNDADANQATDVSFRNIKIYQSQQETIPFSSEVFEMQNGLLAIEAEHASKQISRGEHEWKMRTDHAGTSGEGYLKAGPDIGFSRNKKYKDVSAELQYQFYVDEPGVYYVWIRGLSTSASDDSLHVGLNGEEIITSDRINGFVRNEWSWTNATMDAYPARIEITKAGEHTLNLWMLKDGLLVDKILLSKDPNFIPQGLGPNESAPRVEYQQPLPPTLNPIVNLTNQTVLSLSGTKPKGTSLWLNDVEVIALNDSSEWSYDVSNLTEGAHDFQLTVKNAGGLTSEVVTVRTKVDLTAPVIQVDSANLTNNANYVLSYTVDGIEKTLNRTLTEGQNTLNITETDEAGNESRASFVVTLDTIAPEVVFTSATLTNESNYLLTYTVDGIEKKISKTLIEGQNSFTISEKDLIGNETTASLNVFLDTAPPTIHLTSKTLVNQVNYQLTYLVEGIEKTETYSLREGNNTFAIVEIDNAGNQATQSVDIVLDTTAPQIEILSGLATNKQEYGLVYEVDGVEKSMTKTLVEGENEIKITEIDLAGNQSAKVFTVIYDSFAIEIVLKSSTLVNHKNYELIFDVDGVQEKISKELVEGSNFFTIKRSNQAGTETVETFEVFLDTIAPVIEIESKTWTKEKPFQLIYKVDGVSKVKNIDLVKGKNTFAINEVDQAGNETTIEYAVYYDQTTLLNQTQALSDGTILTFNENGLEQETLPSGESIFYAASRVEKLVYPDGAAIHFSNNNKQALEIFNASGQLVEEITQPVPTPLDESLALKLSLEGGMEVYYISAEAVEYRTAEGVRITDFILDDQNQFQEAYVSYPDGTLEIIRHGFMIRRISPSGSVMDYSPQGKVLRENIHGTEQTYTYFYDTVGELFETRVTSSHDIEVVYDASGLLKTTRNGDQFILYQRTNETVAGVEVSVLTLDPTISVGVTEDSLIRGEYWQNNAPKHLTFQNGNQIFYDESGKLLKTLNASDEETAFDFNQTLNVTKNGTRFSYNQSGFLESIQTDQGTITRLAIDQNGDGEIAGDEVSGLILETLDGSKLRDFELDANGNILKGILETKAGVKQRIENGILTGFETVDGKYYGVAEGKATLQEWKFRDGSRVIYGGGTIQEILYPDGSRLHTIGTENKAVVGYTQDLADGTQRVFEDGKMIKLITNQGHQILYNLKGEAVSVILNDASELEVIRKLDQAGNLESILFKDAFTNHQFSAQGELEALLKGGVQAEIANDEITRLHTRFATIENPGFNDSGVLNGTFEFVDGTTQTIKNGVLVQTVRPTGTIVSYENGTVSDVKTENTHYSITSEYEVVNSEDVLFYPSSDNGSHRPLIIDQSDAKFGGSLETRQIPFQPSINTGENIGSLLVKDEPFTMEIWFKDLDLKSGATLMSQGSAGTHGAPCWFLEQTGNSLEFRFRNEGGGQYVTLMKGDYLPDSNSWDHIAVVRGWGGDIHQWAITVNGKAIAIKSYTKTNFFNNSVLSFGGGFGKYDEARISNIARWTSDFEVPTAPYEVDASTRLLHHFDEKNGTRFSGQKNLVGMRVTKEINGSAETHDLTAYLLDHPKSELHEILNARPLYNTLDNTLGIKSLLKESLAMPFKLEGGAKFEAKEGSLGEKSLRLDGIDDQMKLYGTNIKNLPLSSTIEFRVNFEDWSRDTQIIDSYSEATPTFKRFGIIKQASSLRVQYGPSTYYDFPFNSTEQNAWHHFAIVRNDYGQLRVFQNGKQIGLIDPAPYSPIFGDTILIGNNASHTKGLRGWIDEFRFSSNGRWSQNFVPPTFEYVQDKETQMLFHFNEAELQQGKELILDNVRPANYQEVIYSKPSEDEERTNAIQFNSLDTREWENVEALDSKRDIVKVKNFEGWTATVSDLIDMNGDGLADRIFFNDVQDKWWVQFNRLSQFDDAVEWSGVENPEGWDKRYLKSLGYFDLKWTSQNSYGELIDMNGDNLPDRLVATPESNGVWYIQYNLGTGFSPIEIWAENVHYVSQEDSKARYAIRAYSNDGQELVSDLIDLDGDGLLDRVIRPKVDAVEDATFWFFQKNNGHGFDDALIWEGVDAQFETDPDRGLAIQYDDGMSLNHMYGYGSWLVDINNDNKPDRVFNVYEDVVNNFGKIQKDLVSYIQYNNGEGFSKRFRDDRNQMRQALMRREDSAVYVKNDHSYVLRDMNSDGQVDKVSYFFRDERWYIDYGGVVNRWLAGQRTYVNASSSSFQVDEYKIDSFTTLVEDINSSRYDYLNINLRSKKDLSSNDGEIVISMGDPKKPATYQEWRVDNLTTDWQNFYLKLNQEKQNIDSVRVEFIASGYDLNVPIYIDSLSFISNRADASKDWLDRLLAEENILSEIHSERTQTLSQFLGLTETDVDLQMNWNQFFNVDKQINFNSAGQIESAENLYGTVTHFEDGQVKESVLEDGTKITFNQGESIHQQTQTVTHIDSSVETLELNYGRVRSASKANQSTLQYFYEFDKQGREITVIFDPATGVTEKYLDNLVLSRLKPNGILTQYTYDKNKELQKTEVLYKGRVRDTFYHGISARGNTTLTTEIGVVEEYDDEGNILFHTTPDGYRYEHSFENASKVVTTFVTETEILSDGSEITIQVPIVTLTEDIESEKIHRSRLVAYNTAENEEITYDGAKVKTIKLADDTLITFDQATREQKVNPETGKVELITRIEDATVLHADGTITEFKGGLPLSVTSATGRVISLAKENDHFISTQESVSFHYEQALKIWNETVVASWNRFQLPSSLVVKNETTLEGELITQNFAEGAVEIYEAGKIKAILSEKGERLIRYDYDDKGKIVRIELEGTRRNLESTLLQIRADVAVQRETSLSYLAEREQVIDHSIQGEYVVQRDRLIKIRSQLEANQSEISGIPVKGGSAKGVIGNALTQIQDGINQVNQALEQLANARTKALEQLAEQIRKASEDVEAESKETYAKIQAEQEIAERQVIKQEISPVIFYWYREILGRDASKVEYERLINRAGYETGEFGLQDLIAELYAGDEYVLRSQEVTDIKKSVNKALTDYKILSDEAKKQFAESLGIPLTDVITLNNDEVDAMMEWILKQSIHFGQSAYIALEKMLINADKSFNRIELATHLILIDLMTGTLTPVEQSDLVLSVYAMRLTAKHFGLDVQGLALSYNGLKAMFEDACPQGIKPDQCDFEMILHVDGNHYIVVTGFEMRESLNEAGETVLEEIVHFMDPGVGPESEVNASELTRIAFLEKWLTIGAADDGIGYAISPRAPPASLEASDARVLSADEQMHIRGAFFGLIAIAIVIAIANAVAAVVSAVIAGIAALLAGLVAGLGSIAAGFGSLFSGLATLNFAAALGGLGQIAVGIGQVVGAVFSGVFAFGQSLVSGLYGVALEFGHAIGSAWGGISVTGALKSTAISSAIGYGFQGAGVLLEKIGVSPKIASSITSIGRAVVGVGLLATGNPSGLTHFTAGVSSFLNTHFDISPFANNLINVGTATLGAFAGGAFNPGEGFGALEVGFANGDDVLKSNLVSAGLFALGDQLGIDGNILSLASVPLRAGLGGIFSGGSILQAIGQSLSSPEFLTGAVSIGANIALDKVGAPVFAKDLVSGFINELGKASIKKTGSTVPTWGDLADEVFDKVGGMIKRIGTGIKTVVGNVVSFASNVIEKGLEKTAELFSGAFNREVQEVVTSVAVAGPLGIGGEWVKTAPPYDSGNGIKTVSYKSVDGGATLSVQSIAGSDEVVVTKTENGVTTTNRYTKLQMDDAGNISFETATIQDARADGSIVTQLYVKNELRAWLIEDENGVVIMRSEGAHDSDGNLKDGRLEARQPSYDIRQPSYDIPAPEEKPTPLFYSGFQVNFTVSGGKVASAEVLSNKASTNVINDPVDIHKELYVITNGIGNWENESSDYLKNFRRGMYDTSQNDGVDGTINPVKDIILAPSFIPDENLVTLLKKIMPIEEIQKLINKMVDVANHALEQQQGLQGLSTQVKNSMEAFFKYFGDENRVRPLIAVGYSGGFVPVVEAVMEGNADYNVKSFVSLGGSTLAIGAVMAKAIVDLVETMEDLKTGRKQSTRDAYKAVFNFFKVFAGKLVGKILGYANTFINILDKVINEIGQDKINEAADKFYQGLEVFVQSMTSLEWGMPGTVESDMMVNIYGSKDVLGKIGLGGHRQEWAGFTTKPVSSADKPLINIEIEGADHFDYILGIDKTKTGDELVMNKAVSYIVNNLLLHADDLVELDKYLNELMLNNFAEKTGHNSWRIFL